MEIVAETYIVLYTLNVLLYFSQAQDVALHFCKCMCVCVCHAALLSWDDRWLLKGTAAAVGLRWMKRHCQMVSCHIC